MLRFCSLLVKSRSGSDSILYLNSSRSSSSTIVVALSGGVDSGVAAALLLQQDQNYAATITGVHMSNWNTASHDDDSLSACSSEADWNDAERTAKHLQMPIARLTHLESDYWCHVFEPYIQQLVTTGAMGNPDVACNTHVKFGALLHYCLQRYGPHTTKLATGHYARLWHRQQQPQGSIRVRNGRAIPTVPACLEEDVVSMDHVDWLQCWGSESSFSPLLMAAADPSKDQSYFLAGCSISAFRHVLFPLGDLYKTTAAASGDTHGGSATTATATTTVRDLATRWQLPVAQKRESMGICFVGKRRLGFRSFAANYLPVPTHKLQFRDVDTGTIVHCTDAPAHAVLYTTGQGAKLSGHPQKYFVVDNHWKDHRSSSNGMNEEYQTVSVCAGTHHPALYSDSLSLTSVRWLGDGPPTPLLQSGSMRAQCRIRHLQPLVDCTVTTVPQQQQPFANINSGGVLQVHFDTPMRGIAPGQMAVLYFGLVCLGGGPIATKGATYFELGKRLPESLHPAGHNDLSTEFRRIAACKAA